ncbi:MAG: twin-arginine translocase TatA/TatE family subunit [Terracidiphilus sp.]|nr:twin-arginine translocase TatA/TatE family subunit [Terracidiphilus sp.]
MTANLGMADTLILMVLALVVFGPRRLPQIGRQIGKLMYEFRKASNDFKFQMEEELRQSEEADRRQKEEAERQRALAASPPAQQLDVSAPKLDQPAESAAESAAPATLETATESPYPGETTYPDLAAEGTRSEDATAAAVEGARPEDEASKPEDEAARNEDLMASAVEAARLRIQPPSTGEVVAANPPSRAPQQAELFEQPSETAAPVPANDNVSGANEAERSEPAAHHG